VHVKPDLSIPEHPEVFVIGDLVALNDAKGILLPGVAQVALQQGTAASKNIVHLIRNEATQPFHYFDKGSMATIGRAAAVMYSGKLQLSGFLAWMAWLFIHILFLIGFRNRLMVMIQWAWSYITYERGARLITGDANLPGWPQTAPQSSLASLTEMAPSHAAASEEAVVSNQR
jgi:NADH dehydrogenase